MGELRGLTTPLNEAYQYPRTTAHMQHAWCIHVAVSHMVGMNRRTKQKILQSIKLLREPLLMTRNNQCLHFSGCSTASVCMHCVFPEETELTAQSWLGMMHTTYTLCMPCTVHTNYTHSA